MCLHRKRGKKKWKVGGLYGALLKKLKRLYQYRLNYKRGLVCVLVSSSYLKD